MIRFVSLGSILLGMGVIQSIPILIWIGLTILAVPGYYWIQEETEMNNREEKKTQKPAFSALGLRAFRSYRPRGASERDLRAMDRKYKKATSK